MILRLVSFEIKEPVTPSSVYYAKVIFGFILLLTHQITVSQKQDSLVLDFGQLNWKDVKEEGRLPLKTKVISGSRFEKEIAEIPFTTYVITSKEIRENGYLTLVDALKNLPGIRVSQPGSALEGETFLMRGLHGNTYVKILINDMPIKPFVASGMPIGAQLPIREAERIEVIYGPVATLYGADASAGVINIILKESERPTYVQSNLGIGGQEFQNLDIMIGGKVGKDKQVLTFNLYGNHTSLQDRLIKYDLETLYNPNIYQNLLESQDVSYLDRSNYLGVNGAPFLGKIPHSSTAAGFNFKFRNWELTANSFSRKDHSSIGLSPYAVSYANPLNFIGESIYNAQLNYNKSIGRFRLKAGLGYLFYSLNEQSSYSYVIPSLNLVQRQIIDNNLAADSLNQVIIDYFFSGQRFSSANSSEYYIELLLGYSVNKNVEIAGGINVMEGSGDPLLNYKVETANKSGVQQVNVDHISLSDLNFYLESYLNFGKWNTIIGGAMITRKSGHLPSDQLNFNPRIASQYRWTKRFSIRGSMSSSFRYPSPFYSANSYLISANNLKRLETGANLDPVRTFSFEMGSRWNVVKKVYLDISCYYMRTENFINYGINANNDSDSATLGYYNDDDAFSELLGIQSRISFMDIIPSIRLNSTINVNYSSGREKLNVFSFENKGSELLSLDKLRSQPDWIVQIAVDFKPMKKVRLRFENTLITKSLSRNIIFYQSTDTGNENLSYNAGFYTLDVKINYQFNKQFMAIATINNLFNRQYAGIDATADPDGLIYNPQSQSYIRFGINYKLE